MVLSEALLVPKCWPKRSLRPLACGDSLCSSRREFCSGLGRLISFPDLLVRKHARRAQSILHRALPPVRTPEPHIVVRVPVWGMGVGEGQQLPGQKEREKYLGLLRSGWRRKKGPARGISTFIPPTDVQLQQVSVSLQYIA